MSKIELPSKNLLYPCPVVLVTSRSKEGEDNVFTLAWTGTTNSNPPMLSISVAPSRYSHDMIAETGEFVVNLTNEAMAEAVDYCGLHSGREEDKFEACGLHKTEAAYVKCAILDEAPAALECKVTEMTKLPSHTMFQAEVVAIHVDETFVNEKNKIDLALAKPLVYMSHNYYSVGSLVGNGGFSLKK